MNTNYLSLRTIYILSCYCHYHRYKCWCSQAWRIYLLMINIDGYDQFPFIISHFHYVWIPDKFDSSSVAYGNFSDMKEDENGKMKNWTDKFVWKVSDVQSLNSLLNFIISSQKSYRLEDIQLKLSKWFQYTLHYTKFKVFSH